MNALEQIDNVGKYAYIYGPSRTGKSMLAQRLSESMNTTFIDNYNNNLGLQRLNSNSNSNLYVCLDWYNPVAVQVSDAIKDRTIIKFKKLYSEAVDGQFNANAKVLILSNEPPPTDLPEYYQVLHVTKTFEPSVWNFWNFRRKCVILGYIILLFRVVWNGINS